MGEIKMKHLKDIALFVLVVAAYLPPVIALILLN
nr:MAG TPA: virulence factor [Caudoviricetes sp.]